MISRNCIGSTVSFDGECLEYDFGELECLLFCCVPGSEVILDVGNYVLFFYLLVRC